MQLLSIMKEKERTIQLRKCRAANDVLLMLTKVSRVYNTYNISIKTRRNATLLLTACVSDPGRYGPRRW